MLKIELRKKGLKKELILFFGILIKFQKKRMNETKEKTHLGDEEFTIPGMEYSSFWNADERFGMAGISIIEWQGLSKV